MIANITVFHPRDGFSVSGFFIFKLLGWNSCVCAFLLFLENLLCLNLVHDPTDALSSTLQPGRPDSTNTCLVIFVLKKKHRIK